MTAWQLANARVQDSEALLRAFTDHSPAAMFLKDVEGRYRFVNQRFLQQFRLSREQVLGRTDVQLFPAAQAARFAATDAEVTGRRREFELEERAMQADGEHIHMVVKFPVFDAGGALAGVGGVATEITERKRTEQELLEQRALLSQAQGLAGLGCWEWDPTSGRVSWSEELYRIYGVEPRGFQPSLEAYLEHVHPEDRQRTGAAVARALADGQGFTHEERIRRADGAERTLRTHGEALRDESGRVVKLVGACLDITESRAYQRALQALTRRLVQAEESERRRIAGELHDRVGQDLSALNMNLDILAGQADGEAARRLRDSIALVEGTLQSIENLMAELRPPLLEEYGLGAALRWHVEQFSRRSGVQVTLDDRAREANRKLHPDAAVALFRIAQEALSNVAKHAGAPAAAVTLAAGDGQMALTVCDEGAGFDPAEVAARPTRWGMTTMKERALAAKGSLDVSSAPGRGTTLIARVPI
jgi:two-component system sensor histidine kinase UhpB